MARLENWSVIGPQDPYTPPEIASKHLCGEVYGHPDPYHYDRKLITTSKIVKVEGRTITTLTGTVYTLGNVDPKYAKYVREDLGYELDFDNPIRLLKD